jgi:glucokinase
VSEQQQVLAVDIGGTKTAVGYVAQGTLHTLDRFPTPEDPQAAVDRLAELVADAAETVTGVGIGAPGPLDQERGLFLTPPNLPSWWNFPFVERLREATQLPAILENDANVGALGEAIFGSGQRYRSIYYLTVSTGIGGGLILDGAVHRGHAGMAGEVWAFEPGNFFGQHTGQTILELCSGPGLLRRTRAGISRGEETRLCEEQLDTATLLRADADGDPLAHRIMEEARDALAGLINMIGTTLAPDCVVLAGGLCTDSAWYVDPVVDRVRRWMHIAALSEIPIMRGRLWDSAVLYGATRLLASSGDRSADGQQERKE